MGLSSSRPEGQHSSSTVDDLYAQKRAAVEQSKDCYARGDHSGAKYYSQLAKDLDAKARLARAQQAEQVFQQNNRGRHAGEIDLHGLTIMEATSIVEGAIQTAKQEGRKSLVLIVGKGLHSGAGGPKLKPAMTQLIDKHNLRCTVGVPNEGCLLVEFVRPEEKGWFSQLISNCVIC